MTGQDVVGRLLKESEAARAELAQIVERISDAFIALDSEWRFTYVNERAAAIYNREPRELIGRQIWTEFPEGAGQPLHEDLREAMECQTARCTEDFFESYGRWFERRIYPSPQGVTVFFRDVTERREREAERQRLDLALRVLADCDGALIRATDEQTLLTDICDICVDLGERRLVWVGYAEEDERRTVRPVASAGQEKQFLDAADIRWSEDTRGQGPTGTAIRTERTVITRNAADDPFLAPWRAEVFKYGLATAISLPLRVDGRVIGALTIYDDDPKAFDAEEVRLLEVLAGDLAYGIGSLRAHAERERAQAVARRELETTRLLLDTARTLSATLDLTEILRRLALAAHEASGLSRVSVSLIEPEGRALLPMAVIGRSEIPEGRRIAFERLPKTFVGAILGRKTAILDYELPETPEYDRKVAQTNEWRLVLAVPLLLGDELLGEIGLDEPGERHDFTEREIEIVEGIASEAAIIIRNAQLHETTQETARLGDVLNTVNSSIHSTLDFDEVMQAALDDGLWALGCDVGAIERFEGDHWVVRYNHGFPEELVGRCMSVDEAPNATRVAKQGRPFAIPDVLNEPMVNIYVGRLGLRSVLGVPFLIRGTLIGCVLFYSLEQRIFTEEELDFAGKFGASVALALDNAELYQSECENAEQLAEKDSAIRGAYVDVIDAVTGGKLVLMSPEEMEAALGRPITSPRTIETGQAIGEARHELKRVLLTLDRQVSDVDALVLAACEAFTNAFKHASGVRWWVCRAHAAVQVVVFDRGPGIDFKTLPKATLVPGFSTKMSLGMGFTIMLEVCDRVLLATEKGATQVVLEMSFA